MKPAIRTLMPWDVFRDALEGYRKVVAQDLGLKSATVVDRWCAAPADVDGTGCANPLQRLTQVVRSLQDAGQEVRAGKIVRALCSSIGYVAVPMSDANRALTVESIGEQMSRDGRFVTEAGRALVDNVLSREEMIAMHETAMQAGEHYLAIADHLHHEIQNLGAADVIANAPAHINGATKRYAAFQIRR